MLHECTEVLSIAAWEKAAKCLSSFKTLLSKKRLKNNQHLEWNE